VETEITSLQALLEVFMLGSKDVIATIAVKDLEAARSFYERTLGLTTMESPEAEVLQFQSGSAMLLVYRSQFAGSNQATAATWPVGNDLEKIVTALKGKGVHFEQYDLPGMRREGDIHFAGKQKAAWFKDPDGNILALVGT
jgi:catechol 2,3-dioxygenase-like lactoylglutathione lyase family enzyme